MTPCIFFLFQDSTLLTSLSSLLSQYLQGNNNKNKSHPYQDRGNKAFYYPDSSHEDRLEELQFCISLYETLTLTLHSSHQHMIKVRFFKKIVKIYPSKWLSGDLQAMIYKSADFITK